MSLFAILDISPCDGCDGARCRRDGGCDSLDCDTPGSPWHHFLCSSAIFLRDVRSCQTPGMCK